MLCHSISNSISRLVSTKEADRIYVMQEGEVVEEVRVPHAYVFVFLFFEFVLGLIFRRAVAHFSIQNFKGTHAELTKANRGGGRGGVYATMVSNGMLL